VIYPGLMMSGPKGMPQPVVTRLAGAFDDARKTSSFQKFAKEKYIFQDGMPVVGEALQKHLVDGYKETGELLQKLGVQKK
jgi:tripartite-type tricarboxylate transporter receptor subunit TctC